MSQYLDNNITSPILCILNDDCIQEIFHHLLNIRDFSSSAEVCVRFQSIAKSSYPKKFQSIKIDSSPDALPIKTTQNFLKIFGHLQKSIQWNATDRSFDADTLNSLSKYCGETLKSLTIRDHNINLQFNFDALEKLEIETGSICNFKFPPQVKIVKLYLIKVINFNLNISLKALNLQEFEIVSVRGFKDDILIEFLNQNPQLKSLRVEGCNGVTSSILRGIANRVPGLIKLHIAISNSFVNADDLLEIGQLSGLKSLGVKCPRCSIKSMIENLVERDVPIEELIITGYSNDITHLIGKLKNIKFLNVGNASEENFIALTKDLGNLETLRIECDFLTNNGLMAAILNGRKLTDVVVVIGYQMHIDSKMYNSILATIEERVKILLMIRTGVEAVKEKVTVTNRKWLNVCYF